jgi:hypothetical protein
MADENIASLSTPPTPTKTIQDKIISIRSIVFAVKERVRE